MSAYSEILEIGKQEGEKKGQEKKTREIIASLAERNFSPGDIAQIVKVSEKYVRQQLKSHTVKAYAAAMKTLPQVCQMKRKERQ